MKALCHCLDFMRTGIERVAARMPSMPGNDVLLVRLLMMSGNVVADELENLLRPHGLNESEFRTLVILFSSPNGSAFPSELCQLATQKPTNMTRITNDLVERGLITRMPSEQDRRRVVLSITEQGRQFARQLLPILFPSVSAVLTGFTAQEKSELTRLLTKLVDNVDNLDNLLETRGAPT